MFALSVFLLRKNPPPPEWEARNLALPLGELAFVRNEQMTERVKNHWLYRKEQLCLYIN